MNARTRSIHAVWVLVAGLIVGPATGRSSSAEGNPAPAKNIMCPNGKTLAEAKAPYQALEPQRAGLERKLKAAEGSVDLLRRLKTEHESGQRVWGFFDATDASTGLITLMLDSVKTTSNLMRDLAIDLDKTGTIQAVGTGLTMVETAAEFIAKKESYCDGGSPGEKALTGFIADRLQVSTAVNLALNSCEAMAHQKAHSELVVSHRQAVARFETELVKWNEQARSLRSKLVAIDAKLRGLEEECVAFSQQQNRMLASFAKADSMLSRNISAAHNDAASQHRADSTEALGGMFEQIKGAQSAAAGLAANQRLQQRGRPQVVYVETPPPAPSMGTAASTTSTIGGACAGSPPGVLCVDPTIGGYSSSIGNLRED